MTASLVVAGYELIGSVTNPEYRLAPGFDFGAGEPDQTTIASLYLDGDTVSGDRTKNRTITLPLSVHGINPQTAAGYTSTLLRAVSASTFTVQWTPDGGLPIVFDCYRATWARERSLTSEAQGVTYLTLTFQTKPFGRSPVAQTVTASSSTQVDSFDTAPTGATLSTTFKVEGTGSAKIPAVTLTAPTGEGIATGTVSRSFAAKDLSAATQLSVWHMAVKAGTTGITYYHVYGSITLASAGGSTSYPVTIGAATAGAGTTWALVGIPLTGGTVVSGSGVTLAAVTSYSFAYTAHCWANLGSTGTVQVYLDNLAAVGSASTLIGPTTHAAVLAVPSVSGSARTPVNLALSNGTTFVAGLLHSPPVDQDDQAQILSSLSTGSTDQTVTVAAANAIFRGTYAVVLGVGTVGGGSVTATVTVTQKENGTTVGVATVLTKTYTSGPHLIPVGDVTLPMYDTPSDNTLTSYTVRVQITGADRYSELMLLDTRGQTVYTDTDLPAAVAALYVDEPSALQSGAPVYGSATDRTAAYGVVGNSYQWGGPIVFEAGTNKLLLWVATSTPNVAATYYPRWVDERVS